MSDTETTLAFSKSLWDFSDTYSTSFIRDNLNLCNDFSGGAAPVWLVNIANGGSPFFSTGFHQLAPGDIPTGPTREPQAWLDWIGHTTRKPAMDGRDLLQVLTSTLLESTDGSINTPFVIVANTPISQKTLRDAAAVAYTTFACFAAVRPTDPSSQPEYCVFLLPGVTVASAPSPSVVAGKGGYFFIVVPNADAGIPKNSAV